MSDDDHNGPEETFRDTERKLREQLEAARADAKEAEAYAEELAGDQVDLCRQLIAAEDKLAKAVEAVEIDIRHVMMDEIEKAVAESPWVPSEYSMNEVVSDICDFLRSPRAALAEIEGEKT